MEMKSFIFIIIAFLAGNLIPYLILAGNSPTPSPTLAANSVGTPSIVDLSHVQTSLAVLTSASGDQLELLNKLIDITQGKAYSSSSDVGTPSKDAFMMRYQYFDALLNLLIEAKQATKQNMRDGIVRHVHITNDTTWFWRIVGPNDMKNAWETQTFDYLKKYLRPTDTYLDFGAWIGPTVLYAAHYVKRVIALEPDPAAFLAVSRNIALNPEVAGKTSLYPYCISSKSGKVNMTGIPGSSTSRIDAVGPAAKDSQVQTWTVDCFTIEDLLARLNVEKLDMIKIDTEGAEAFIIPAIKDFLLKQKPTLYLSFHHLKEDKMKEIRPILANYKYFYNDFGKPVDMNNFSCESCAVLITDRDDV